MRIILVHQQVPADAAADERDVLEQVSAIRTALTGRGHAVSVLPCTTDLGNVQRKLEVLKPDCVFNLVETLDGSGRLIHLAPALWETKGLTFTGSSADALYLTTHKGLAKERMFAAGLSIPPWIVRSTTDSSPVIYGSDDGAPDDWIIKSIWEHASVGLGDGSILRGISSEAVAERLPAGFFAERFIDGREFNLALLAGPNGPEVLPPAEIVFVDFPADKPKIVGYPAKWDETSFEYTHTVRRFADPATDGHLIDKLKRLALRCWEVFELRGYARVDFRVDAHGKPWILEVNTNPCLSPDSGFAAALNTAGIAYADAMERIVRDAVKTRGKVAAASPSRPPQKAPGPAPALTWRYEVTPADVAAIREVTASTGYFHDDEIDVAAELVEERLAKGAASGYEFVLAECDGRLIGYTTFGPVPCTKTSFDWYWLAVRPELQGFGFGKQLLRQVEQRAKAMGGTRLYCETSGRPQYATTRAFYEHMAFTLCEVLDDYYDVGDGRATYTKPL
jgi:D-alanine-D-alanine ligase-like ATP-grasp enzyme/GNAT superfamily N-acetyltransferase